MRICMINIHGHLKANDPPIGIHPDSGGQLVYVLNLAHYLANSGNQVDLFTRKFVSKKFSGFDDSIEKVNKNFNIIRIPCGPKEFVMKEEIWPYVDEFTRGIEAYYKDKKLNFDIINAHYADSGIAGVLLKARLNKPLVYVGHSLGAIKLQNAGLEQNNFLSVNKKFSFHTRLFAERTILDWADGVIVATEEERYQQYGLPMYEGAIDVEDARFKLIPPGVNTEKFYNLTSKSYKTDIVAEKKIMEIMEDGIDPSRRSLPGILTVARLDPKKNILGLLKAYAANKKIQELANLYISAGGMLDPTLIKNWEGMQTSYKNLLKDIRKIIVKSNIQGKVVLTDVFNYENEYPGILRYAAKNKWIYANTAFFEPRGIAILEAMASGLPVVTTCLGSIPELIEEEAYAYLIDPNNTKSIEEAILNLLSQDEDWNKFSKEGSSFISKKYAWKNIAKEFETYFAKIISKKELKQSKFVLLPPRYLRKPSDKSEKDLIDDLRTFIFSISEGKRQASKVARDLADVIIDELLKQNKKPFVFAMAGQTGAGKSTIANKLSRTLNNLGYESVIFRMEDYLKDLPKDMIEKRVKKGGMLGLEEIDIASLNEHIRVILKGGTVTSPVINIKANSRKMRSVSGKSLAVIIVEGVYCDKLDTIDMLIYFDIPFDQLRFQRAKKDDVNLYPKGDEVRTLLEDISRSEQLYLDGTNIKNSADLIINWRYEILYRNPFRNGPLI